jgi:ribosomal protein S18 acetylase RimI-like enzyme
MTGKPARSGGVWRVRPAVDADLQALTDLCFRSKQSNGYDDAFMAVCRAELAVTATSLRQARYWLAMPGSASSICGCAALAGPVTDTEQASGDPNGDDSTGYGEVHAFFVDPNWQRQGVGMALWEHLLLQAQRSGMTGLYLDADPNAVPFYESIGFVVTGQSESGSIPGRLLPRMSRAI